MIISKRGLDRVVFWGEHCREEFVPDADHVVVHLLQLLLGDIDGVRRGVKLVGLEALIAEGDGEVLVLGLRGKECR